jgi:hypothetical protein
MDRPHYIGFSKLREILGLTWNRYLHYWEKDVIPQADATVGDKPIWLMSSLDRVIYAIDNYEALQVAAHHNAISTN